jgi:RNA polymerase sigma-70 factor (sigma-E family)
MACQVDDFDSFVRANLNGLRRTAYLISWDAREAEDLVQDCLIKVARRWGRVSRMAEPLAYTRRVLVHLALRGSDRRARRHAELNANGVDIGVESEAITGLDTREELFSALAQLPARQRAVIVLRYFLDMTEADAAQALGCSTGTVKSTTSKGLSQLRLVLGPKPLYPEVCEP